MELAVLSQIGGFLGPFAWIMGKILNGIYTFLELFGVANIAVCIVLFTIVIKMLMLPLTIKQQKGAKLSAKMNPEIQKVQAKYKGKKDQASMQKQQMEMQEIYSKYGTSPLAGCLPLLISLPIMFALYQVIYRIPAYVGSVKEFYDVVATQFMTVSGYAEGLTSFVKTNMPAVSVGDLTSLVAGSLESKTVLIDILSKFNTTDWNTFLDSAKWAGTAGTDIVQYFTDPSSLGQLKDVLSNQNVITAVDEIKHVNRFIGNMNILDPAGYHFPGILIPIFAAGSQFLQSKLMMGQQPTNNNAQNPGADTMKTMNTVMPLMSGVFCVFFPIGVGIYWIANSAVQTVQQIFINRYFDKVGMDAIIAKNIEKSNKKKEKLGVATGNKMASVAKTPTKTINTQQKVQNQAVATKTVNNTQQSAQNKTVAAKTKKYDSSDYKKSEVSYKAGSIAANANILKRNNSDKGDK